MRYPSRLLSDDQQRAFAQRRNVHGGVVVIDQSGSMDIDDTDMAGLLSHAPNALVIGYSHRPGDGGLNPNAWLLANRGAVAKHWPSGNVGNGVDGPALAWAIARRRGNEPVVWVTDGQVTDSHDHPDEALTLYCAELVRRHRVRLVANLSDVGRALQNSGVPRRSAWAQFGRVGRKMLEFQAN
jgi:hypothetical protein